MENIFLYSRYNEVPTDVSGDILIQIDISLSTLWTHKRQL